MNQLMRARPMVSPIPAMSVPALMQRNVATYPMRVMGGTTWRRMITEYIPKLGVLGKAGLKALNTAGQALFTGHFLTDAASDLVDITRGWASDDLPPIQNELNLFISMADQPGGQQDLYKQIIYKLVDMNRRYLQLNTTKAKNAFNRIMHVTTLNSVRKPTKAMEHIARAELDLGRLWQAYLGSDRGKPELTSRREDTYDLSSLKQVEHSDVASKYYIEHPINIAAKAAAESHLPSSVLYNIPFPDYKYSGRFVPGYEKQEYLNHPSYLEYMTSRDRKIRPAGRPTNRKRRYRLKPRVGK